MLKGVAILAFGTSYRTAAIDVRERVAFANHEIAAALASLRTSVPLTEAVILATCNRTELYCAGDPSPTALGAWLAANRGVDAGILERCSYLFRGRQAVGHSMRVAAGLDSQVLGEPQITGQFKAAYEIARAAGTLGAELGFLADMSLKVAKRARAETDIGRNPVSIAYAAVTLARRVLPDVQTSPALLIGAGENIELVARHLHKAGVGRVVIANRTVENARAIALRVGGEAIPLAELGRRLFEFDLVVSSTDSSTPVLDNDTVQQALEERRHRPMIMVDLAVPRDIEPEVGALDDVRLYSIDALTEIIDETVAGRRAEAAKAGDLIRRGVDEFTREWRIRANRALMRAFREQGARLTADVLGVAKKRLSAGHDPAEVLERLARDLSRKLLHPPTAAIREASGNGDAELLATVRKLYGL